MRPDPDTLFFIIGTGRCGSTLLQAMLSSHSRLYIPPELRYFGRHDPIVGFRDPLQEPDVGPYLMRCADDIWWTDMGLDRDAFEAAVRGGVRGAGDIYLWVLGHVAERRGNAKPRIGEKTPYYALLADRIDQLFPRARFVHLYRDPRDVAASYLEQYWVAGGTALRCAGYVRHVLLRMERLARRVGPERYCAVGYEALVAAPERELARLCSFLGERYEPQMLEFRRREDPGYLEVEKGWKGLTEEPLTTSRIGRFSSRLSPRQVWTVERMLGPLLPAHGYEAVSPARVPLAWSAAFWEERIRRKALRTLGVRPPLLDEQAVLARRNELVRARGDHPAKG
jgi:hypothetical protein